MTFKPDAASTSAIPQASTSTPATELFGGSAVGATVSVIAVARSDVAST